MRSLVLLILAVTFSLAIAAISAQVGSVNAQQTDKDPDAVEIVVLNESNFNEYVPKGKEVDAIYGDIVLRNKYLTAVIARPVATRNANMTVRSVAGCLIDLTTSEYQSDQLSCLYPGASQYTYTEWQVEAGQGASDASEPVTPTDSYSATGSQIAVSVTAPGNNDRLSVTTTYLLNSKARALTIRTKYTNTSKKTMTISPTDRIRADGGKEWMKKSPNGTTDQFWINDEYWQQAYGVIPNGGVKIQCNSDSRNSTLKYLSASGSDVLPLKPGKSKVVSRRIVPRQFLPEVHSHGQPRRRVRLTLSDQAGQAVSNAILELTSDGKSYGVLRTNDDGRCIVRLPIGTTSATVHRYGEQLESQPREITVDEGEGLLKVDWQLENYHPGNLVLKVADGEGNPIPCKIEIVGQGNATSPDFGPETAEYAVKNLRYSPDGHCEQPLSAGQYLLRVSHGPEFSAEEIEVEIRPGKTAEESVTLYRTIDTTGWVSSDFHSHSTPSGDNTSSQLGRVLNLVCEHVEFAPCTEHNRISTYQPHFEHLGIEQFISSVTGMELTGSPLPLNHQNVFPLHHHPHHQDGGGPTTDSDVNRQVQRIAAWDDGSEKLIQQNHPDVGWLVYDKNGDGEHDEGHAEAIALIDVMEIHPVDRVLQIGKTDDVTQEEAKSNRIFKWLQLINQGKRIPGVVNTDAHYNFHGSGWLRNWIQSSTDDPAKIDPMEMVHASEEGRVVMSNGPFLRMNASSGEAAAGVGEDLVAKNGKVEVEVSVQCPNWLEVDTVFVLLNGRAREDLIFTKESHPDLFQKVGAGSKAKQVFKKEISLNLESDTHLVAVAGGTNTTLGPVVGPSWQNRQPSALTNPIYVDVDGDGFTPNGDTLGRPLPVKGD